MSSKNADIFQKKVDWSDFNMDMSALKVGCPLKKRTIRLKCGHFFAKVWWYQSIDVFID